ncbi:MAG: hypothetical protein H8E34_12920 [Bacteroidetes bacterium]|nr:hypothetical protein [Bacteroidota bacterium]MBL6943273.1 hypothetical protein [Bacteroidales bacterium]
MKKAAIILIIALIVLMPSHLKSQNNYVVGFAFVGIVLNQASISYEYSLNKNNSLGVQATSSLLWFYAPNYSSDKIVAYYRYYFNPKPSKGITYFAHAEAGYYNFYEYYLDSFDHYTISNNISMGYLIGGRRYFGTSEMWFSDFALGVNLGYRMHGGDGQWDYDGDYNQWYYREYPPDRFVILPRVIVEVGFRF